jgi:predicted ATP-grasp superfamily ATP-dependent carboligase
VVNCTGNVTYKSAGATVVIASNPVSATVTVKDTANPPVAIYQARVLVLADTGGPMPYNVTVTSITNAGTTATVAHTSHNMATNDKVQITGASLWQNNGVFSITKTNDNEYTYTLPSAPGSSPTGTIKATYVALEGLTDTNGQITMSRSFTSSQSVTGRARYSSGAPYKKTNDFTGSINSSSGMSLTIQLLPDS